MQVFLKVDDGMAGNFDILDINNDLKRKPSVSLGCAFCVPRYEICATGPRVPGKIKASEKNHPYISTNIFYHFNFFLYSFLYLYKHYYDDFNCSNRTV